jgi:hypothetical protein
MGTGNPLAGAVNNLGGFMAQVDRKKICALHK